MTRDAGGQTPSTETDSPRKNRSPGVRETVQMLRFGVRGLYATKLPQMAAALAFRTLFALVPMLVISVAVIGAFADPDQVRSTLDRALESSGVSEIVISEGEIPGEGDQSEGEPGSGSGEAAPESVGGVEGGSGSNAESGVSGSVGESDGENDAETDPDTEDLDRAADSVAEALDLPAGGEAKPAESTPAADEPGAGAAADSDSDEVRLEKFLNDLVTRLLEIPFGAIGAAGLLTLIYAAISMLTEIEKSFNQVYRAKALRSWGRRITQYWSVLTLGALLIFSAFYTSEQFRGFDSEGLGSFLSAALGTTVSVAITTLLLLLGYQTIPNTRVHLRSSLVGALVAAILWEVAKWAFRQYIEFSVSYAKLYGSIGVLPLFMLWIYATWLIVLFGLQVSYGLQHLSVAREMMNQPDDDDALTDPASSVALVAYIGRRFEKGKPTEAGELADELGLRAAAVAAMLEKLTDRGVLHAVDGGEERYALAVPADKVRVSEVIEAAQSLVAGHVGDGPAAEAMRRLRAAEREAIGAMTLADLLGGDREPERDEPTGVEA